MSREEPSYYEADHDHAPEADREPHFTEGELNYDKTLVQIQVNFDFCSLSLSITVTKFYLPLH